MTGGNSMRVSAIALMAAAGFVLAFPANAADLGGNCCADLEERVAELEATTARKGNRKMSLQLWGQISETLLFWDDGGESNTYVAENNAKKNLFGGKGSAKINGDWSAGYQFEIQLRTGRSSSMNQRPLASTEGQTASNYGTRSITIRKAYWYLKSNSFGTISLGRQNDASAGTGHINLASPDGFAGNGYTLGRTHQSFFLRSGSNPGNAGLSSFRWTNAWHRNFDDLAQYDYSGNSAILKYTSPFFLGQTKKTGMQLQAGWGNDDTFTVGLRYVEQLGAFRLAAGVGYLQDSTSYLGHCSNLRTTTTESAVDCSMWQTSASVMHMPTGLYISGGYGELTDNNRVTLANRSVAGLGGQIDDTDSSWWVQAGWAAKLNTLGKTTFWGSYAEFESSGNVSGQAIGSLGAGDVLNSIGQAAFVKSANATIWGLGVTQDIDAAAMKLYVGYTRSSADFTLIDSTNIANQRKSNKVEDFDVIYSGATLKF